MDITLQKHTTERNYGLDLFKILCMFFVIAFHFSDHGKISINCTQDITFNWNVLAISRIFGGICNCGFMLISGYFLYTSKFNVKNIVRLYLQVWFYSVVFGIICYCIGTETFTLKSVIKMLFPFTFNQYWYFSTYIYIYLFFPFFNKLINVLNRKQHLWLIVIGLFLTTFLSTLVKAEWLIGSNNIPIFICMYFIGAYINRFGISIKKKTALTVAVTVFILAIASFYVMRLYYKLTGVDCFYYFVWRTEKILAVAESIALFLLFKDFRLKPSKSITFLSSSVFGVYLFHIGRFSVFLFKRMFDNSITYYTNLLLPQLLLSMVTIFIAGIIIDKIRIYIFEKPVMKIIKKPVEIFNNKLEKFYN